MFDKLIALRRSRKVVEIFNLKTSACNLQPKEQGQVLILLVLAVVGLLGFAALALDGGMVYSDRRTAQNAADAAVLSGAGAAAHYAWTYDVDDPRDNPFASQNWECSDSAMEGALVTAEQAAMNRAARNDFPIDQNTAGDNWVDAQCVGKKIIVHVRITTETRSTFSHFIYKGPLVNTVNAETELDPSVPVGAGNTIISLSLECTGNSKGVIFDGNHNTIIRDGGIWSNSCIFANGVSGYVNVTIESEGETVGTGTITYIQKYFPNGNITDQVTPKPTRFDGEPLEVDIEPPNCSGLPNRGNHSGSGEIRPGIYNSIRLNNNQTLVMKPGLYCLDRSFTISGGRLTGEDVTIYLRGNNSNFTSSGNATINLDAPTPGCEAWTPDENEGGCYPALGGMLIYAAKGNVSLLGTSDSYYEGTVYAPKGKIDVGGEASDMSVIGTQLIGDTVKVHGDVTIDIRYDGLVIYNRGPRVTLSE